MAAMTKQLEEVFSNLEKLKPEQLDSLIQQAIKTFHSLQEKIESKDPKDTQKAIQTAIDLKESLETQMTELLTGIGVNPEELKTFMNDTSNFAPEEQTLIKQINHEMHRFLSTDENGQNSESKKKKNKTKKEWLPS